MRNLFDNQTLLMTIGALLICMVTIAPALHAHWAIYLSYRILFFGDTLFHEMGHAVFGWLYGRPSIPSIFTVFGTDQAAGFTMTFDRHWYVQAASFGLLAVGCYRLRSLCPDLLLPAMLLAVVLAIIGFTPYTDLVFSYMGHGGAMLSGGFLLWRGWLYVDARNGWTRGLNILFGLFIILNNMALCWGLAFDPILRNEYSGKTIGGAVHHDFETIAQMIPGWSVFGVALFTLGFGCAILIGTCLLAIYCEETWEE